MKKMMSSKLNQQISMSETLLAEIHALTEQALNYLQDRKWNDFQGVLEKRQEKIGQLLLAREEFSKHNGIEISEKERTKANRQLYPRLKNIAKVDKKIFDIMNGEKNMILEKLNQASQGKNFLRNYKKQVNHRKTFYRMI